MFTLDRIVTTAINSANDYYQYADSEDQGHSKDSKSSWCWHKVHQGKSNAHLS